MADNVTVRKRRITDYTPDPHNANKGTERGQYMIDQSVTQSGAHRSLVATADDMIPIGNHTLQALADAGIMDVVEIETDGKTAVVVKRKDWQSIDDPAVRQAAILDNRTSELGLAWDVDRLLESIDGGVDLSMAFTQDDLTDLSALSAIEETQAYNVLADITDHGAVDAEPKGLQDNAYFPLSIVLGTQDRRRWRALKEQLGYKDDTRAFMAVLVLLEDSVNA